VINKYTNGIGIQKSFVAVHILFPEQGSIINKKKKEELD
jgi:hypothetical protein